MFCVPPVRLDAGHLKVTELFVVSDAGMLSWRFRIKHLNTPPLRPPFKERDSAGPPQLRVWSSEIIG